MLRIHCMQHWYNLSDGAMEDALYEIASMRLFARLSLDSALPDRTTPSVAEQEGQLIETEATSKTPSYTKSVSWQHHPCPKVSKTINGQSDHFVHPLRSGVRAQWNEITR